jgi:hypothetical protein
MKYSEINTTELVHLCKKAGYLIAHRGLGRDTLIGLLKGQVQNEDCAPDPVDDDRELMCYFQQEHPDITFNQLKCADQHYYCPDCPPGRVIYCAVYNIDSEMREEGLIQIGLKSR